MQLLGLEAHHGTWPRCVRTLVQPEIRRVQLCRVSCEQLFGLETHRGKAAVAKPSRQRCRAKAAKASAAKQFENLLNKLDADANKPGLLPEPRVQKEAVELTVAKLEYMCFRLAKEKKKDWTLQEAHIVNKLGCGCIVGAGVHSRSQEA